MRWYHNPKNGQKRIRCLFPVIPLTLPNEWGTQQTRWLEIAYIKEQFNGEEWLKIRWSDSINEQENWSNQ